MYLVPKTVEDLLWSHVSVCAWFWSQCASITHTHTNTPTHTHTYMYESTYIHTVHFTATSCSHTHGFRSRLNATGYFHVQPTEMIKKEKKSPSVFHAEVWHREKKNVGCLGLFPFIKESGSKYSARVKILQRRSVFFVFHVFEHTEVMFEFLWMKIRVLTIYSRNSWSSRLWLVAKMQNVTLQKDISRLQYCRKGAHVRALALIWIRCMYSDTKREVLPFSHRM